MGNTAPQRRCREAGTATRGEEGKNSKKVAEVKASAAPRCAAVTQRMQRDDKEQAGRRRSGGDGSSAGSGGTVATVKIVMSMKDAEALVARLHAQSAKERKARMAELKHELRAGDGSGGGASPMPCRDAWRPRLAPVKENQFQ